MTGNANKDLNIEILKKKLQTLELGVCFLMFMLMLTILIWAM